MTGRRGPADIGIILAITARPGHAMPRFLTLLLPLLLTATLTACDQKPSREQQILAQLPLQDAYVHNIERMAALLGRRHPQLSQATIEDVLRKHLTVEDQRQDLFRLYSERTSAMPSSPPSSRPLRIRPKPAPWKTPKPVSAWARNSLP